MIRQSSKLLSLVASCLYTTDAFVPQPRHSVTFVETTDRQVQTRLHIGDFLQNVFGGFGDVGEETTCDLCVVGGGVSGLASALAFQDASSANDMDVVLLEGSPTLGGRVQSDVTPDGFTLDRGFAVFIEEYPYAKKLLDYDALKLSKFEPGALVFTGTEGELFKVADPIRRPLDLFVALTAPVGDFADKIRVLPLLLHVFTTSIDDLFAEEETDTLTCLKERYGFSDAFISEFMQPFLEGIYLAPLNEQSSRMFHFVFKMFSEGSACLPLEGMGAISAQMAEKCKSAGIDIRTSCAVKSIESVTDKGIVLNTVGGKVRAQRVVIATEGNVAQELISTLPEFTSLKNEEAQTQRSVGCLYYSFDSDVPVSEPILILNGASRDPEMSPVNNICFPSVVSSKYTPKGSNVCSVTILKPAMDYYDGRVDDLDAAVRKQLTSWFPSEFSDDILNKWELKGSYDIKNAQPAQFNGPTPANVNGGRGTTFFRDQPLPKGVFVCGDHMATATLNGALESGVNAGEAAASVA